MARLVPSDLQTTAKAIHPGTTVRYHYRNGDSLATVVEKTDRYVTFVGKSCDGRFTFDQIDRLVEDGRLAVVLDDDFHAGRRRLAAVSARDRNP